MLRNRLKWAVFSFSRVFKLEPSKIKNVKF